jgi:hypothetical protein
MSNPSGQNPSGHDQQCNDCGGPVTREYADRGNFSFHKENGEFLCPEPQTPPAQK